MLKQIKYYIIKLWYLILKLFKKSEIDNKIFKLWVLYKLKPQLEKLNEKNEYIQLLETKISPVIFKIIKDELIKYIIDNFYNFDLENDKKISVKLVCEKLIRLYNENF